MPAKIFSFITKLPVDCFKEKILIYFILDLGRKDDTQNFIFKFCFISVPAFLENFSGGSFSCRDNAERQLFQISWKYMWLFSILGGILSSNVYVYLRLQVEFQ